MLTQKKVNITILVLIIILEYRLYAQALSDNNWIGFIFSTIHILIVAFATKIALSEYIIAQNSNSQSNTSENIK
jgi:chromate transport protein ChrA